MMYVIAFTLGCFFGVALMACVIVGKQADKKDSQNDSDEMSEPKWR